MSTFPTGNKVSTLVACALAFVIGSSLLSIALWPEGALLVVALLVFRVCLGVLGLLVGLAGLVGLVFWLIGGD